MSISPQLLQRFQQLVAQGVPQEQAIQQAQQEMQGGLMPDMNSSPGADLGQFGQAVMGGLGSAGQWLQGAASRGQSNMDARGIQNPDQFASAEQSTRLPGINDVSDALGGLLGAPQQANAAEGPTPPQQQAPQGGGPSAPQGETPKSGEGGPPPTAQGGPGAAQDNGTPPTPGTTAGPNAPGGAPSQAGGSPYGTGTPGENLETRFGSSAQGPGEWAQRAFLNAMQDQGTNLYDPNAAHSPFGSWLQARYIPELESKLVTGRATGQVGDGTEASFAQGIGGMRDASAGGGAPANSPFAGVLGTASALNRFANHDTAGMSVNQTGVLGDMVGPGGTNIQSRAILGAMRGPMGGWGMDYAQNVLDSLQRQYANNTAQYDPSTFMGAALGKLNIR